MSGRLTCRHIMASGTRIGESCGVACGHVPYCRKHQGMHSNECEAYMQEQEAKHQADKADREAKFKSQLEHRTYDYKWLRENIRTTEDNLATRNIPTKRMEVDIIEACDNILKEVVNGLIHAGQSYDVFHVYPCQMRGLTPDEFTDEFKKRGFTVEYRQDTYIVCPTLSL